MVRGSADTDLLQRAGFACHHVLVGRSHVRFTGCALLTCSGSAVFSFDNCILMYTYGYPG